MKLRKGARMGVLIGIIVLVIACVVVMIFDGIVVINASGRTYETLEEVPHNKYGMLLATSPVTAEGEPNHSFANRIRAAEELFKAGKVEFIIASGGDYRGEREYGCDEPQSIIDELTARGVPAEKIIADYDGRRTIHSVRNARKSFGLDSVTFISQKYHNERAIYMADKHGLKAVGYNAAPTPSVMVRMKNGVREYMARVKMFMEL